MRAWLKRHEFTLLAVVCLSVGAGSGLLLAIVGVRFNFPDDHLLQTRVARVASEAQSYNGAPGVPEGWTIETCEAEVRYLLEQLDDCYSGPVYRCCCEGDQDD